MMEKVHTQKVTRKEIEREKIGRQKESNKSEERTTSLIVQQTGCFESQSDSLKRIALRWAESGQSTIIAGNLAIHAQAADDVAAPAVTPRTSANAVTSSWVGGVRINC